MHDLTDHIEVYVEGLVDAGAFIEEFLDVKTGLVNQRATKGGQFIRQGNKIKVVRTSARTGFFFTTPGSPAVAIKATEVFAVNDPQRITGIIPVLLSDKQGWRERLARKCLRFSKKGQTRKIVIDLIINVWFLGRVCLIQ
jgi:hypothetical protein